MSNGTIVCLHAIYAAVAVAVMLALIHHGAGYWSLLGMGVMGWAPLPSKPRPGRGQGGADGASPSVGAPRS